MNNIEREIYAGPAVGFFDKDKFISVMKLLHARGEGGAGSITTFELDGVRIEYCITYTMGNRPNLTNIKLAGPKQKVDWLEQIIENEKDFFGKNKK
ncbi:MAG: hypothetical protein HYT16_03705 [DPANN group archaeon]|nr:hypothetical protein [DPANN group archaeon]